MQWITEHSTIAAGMAFFAALIIARQAILCGTLLYRRMRVRDYNRFVYTTYTSQDKSTPVLILRIQDDNIQQYNGLLNDCRFLSLFFKEISYIGEPPEERVDLSPINNL